MELKEVDQKFSNKLLRVMRVKGIRNVVFYVEKIGMFELESKSNCKGRDSIQTGFKTQDFKIFNNNVAEEIQKSSKVGRESFRFLNSILASVSSRNG